MCNPRKGDTSLRLAITSRFHTRSRGVSPTSHTGNPTHRITMINFNSQTPRPHTPSHARHQLGVWWHATALTRRHAAGRTTQEPLPRSLPPHSDPHPARSTRTNSQPQRGELHKPGASPSLFYTSPGAHFARSPSSELSHSRHASRPPRPAPRRPGVPQWPDRPGRSLSGSTAMLAGEFGTPTQTDATTYCSTQAV